MKKPISVQLYSLREASEKAFVGVVKKVASYGYEGVEPAGLYGMKPEAFRRLVEDIGMVVSSNHGPWPSLHNINEVIETAQALGTDKVVCGFMEDGFRSLAAIDATAEVVNAMVERVEAAGLRMCLHNHWWEFEELDGVLKYDLLMERCPKLLCEVDTYWAANFGDLDPAEQVRRWRHRTPLLHIKDGPLVRGGAHVAVGSGKVDICGILQAADPGILEWLVVELDKCDSDMGQAIQASLVYLRALQTAGTV